MYGALYAGPVCRDNPDPFLPEPQESPRWESQHSVSLQSQAARAAPARICELAAVTLYERADALGSPMRHARRFGAITNGLLVVARVSIREQLAEVETASLDFDPISASPNEDRGLRRFRDCYAQ